MLSRWDISEPRSFEFFPAQLYATAVFLSCGPVCAALWLYVCHNVYGRLAFSVACPTVCTFLSHFIWDSAISADCFRRSFKT